MKKFILLLLILPLTLMARPEKRWLQIPMAGFFGSVKWEQTTNCVTNLTPGATFQTIEEDGTSDADCDDNARTIKGEYNTTNGDVGNADGTYIGRIKFSKMPAGHYQIIINGKILGGVNSYFQCRYTDGTNDWSISEILGVGTNSQANMMPLISTYHYTTEQTDVTLDIDCKVTNGANNIDFDARNTTWTVMVYYSPDFSDSRYIITK